MRGGHRVAMHKPEDGLEVLREQREVIDGWILGERRVCPSVAQALIAPAGINTYVQTQAIIEECCGCAKITHAVSVTDAFHPVVHPVEEIYVARHGCSLRL